MFSTEYGTPFAIINGGHFNGKFLRYVTNPSEVPQEDSMLPYSHPIEILEEMGYYNKFKEAPQKTWEAYRKFAINKEGSISTKTKRLFEDATAVLSQRKGKEFFLNDGGKLSLLPSLEPDEREEIFIAGPPSSGKTYQACDFMMKYQDIHPGRPIYVFTTNENDKTFSLFPNLQLTFIDLEETIPVPKAKKRRTSKHEKEEEPEQPIELDPSKYDFVPLLVKEPISPKELDNSLVFFDDIDYIPNKEVKKVVKDLEVSLRGIGRHENTTVVTTGHQLTNYHDTRFTLATSKYVTVFPKMNMGRSLEYYLRNYLKVDTKPFLSRIEKLPSRWVTIHTRLHFLLHESGAFWF